MYQILFGPQVSLCRLNRRMPEKQLDLLKFTACGPAKLRAGPSKVVRCDIGNASDDRILVEHLPDHLIA